MFGCYKSQNSSNSVNLCQQLIVVIATENSHQAVMSAYQRDSLGHWYLLLEPMPAVVGEKGLTKEKVEGDLKTPSGLFPLLQVFGDKRHATMNMPFIELSSTLEAIDDPLSKHYNLLIDRKNTNDVDWKSSEKLEALYRLGIVIGYNTEHRIPGKGSCIFLHSWKNKDQGTLGCVAVAHKHMEKMTSLLQHSLHPHILVATNTFFTTQ